MLFIVFFHKENRAWGNMIIVQNDFRLWLSLVLLQSSAYGLTNGTILCFQLFT